ncbi:MAG: 2-hydroxyacyl-CoA dehydratase family protein, partial [Clostridia bacterium]|nr:2-hydroxyacyl-CoA dehydratase family protein [Clostridia bacterium]
CDANIGTFAYLSKKLSIPYFVMDIPHKKNEKAVCYVVNQLNEMIHQLEKLTGNRFNHDRLKAILLIENQTIEYRKKVLKLMTEKDLSITITHEMYMMNAAHVVMGTEEILEFYTSLYHDLTKARPRHKKRILWVHTLPFPFEPFKKYFNHNDNVEIIGMELNYPKLKVLDETRPLDALADKMIDNVYNGPYIKKMNHVIEMAQTLKVDGIVHFCHWGCRQNAGGTALLKKACQEVELPFLSLDGDGIDMRNNQQGQMITRMDAFLEMVDRW